MIMAAYIPCIDINFVLFRKIAYISFDKASIFCNVFITWRVTMYTHAGRNVTLYTTHCDIVVDKRHATRYHNNDEQFYFISIWTKIWYSFKFMVIMNFLGIANKESWGMFSRVGARSASPKPLYLQHIFWWTLKSTHSAEHVLCQGTWQHLLHNLIFKPSFFWIVSVVNSSYLHIIGFIIITNNDLYFLMFIQNSDWRVKNLRLEKICKIWIFSY